MENGHISTFSCDGFNTKKKACSVRSINYFIKGEPANNVLAMGCKGKFCCWHAIICIF
jgi:predicted AAA+ superfamily ATPase